MSRQVPSSADNIRNQQLQARELEKLSTVLIDAGINVVKKNPVPTGLYFIGILICLFFSGSRPTLKQEAMYERQKFTPLDSAMRSIDHHQIGRAAQALNHAEYMYRKSKGWFSCDKKCQFYKTDYDIATREYDFQRAEEGRLIADAKSNVGIFSSFGVEETRGLFWTRFANGREFAQKQTKWDALFMGIGAMAKNESLSSYIMRLGMSMLFNFTIGIFGAVVAFIFNLYGLIRSYRENIFAGLFFFFFAAVASIAFAMTWIIGLYVAAAGTVYVGSKVAANIRIEDGRRQQYGGRMRNN